MKWSHYTRFFVLQPDTFADLESMTKNLVDEILYHIDIYGIDPERIRYFVCSVQNSTQILLGIDKYFVDLCTLDFC